MLILARVLALATGLAAGDCRTPALTLETSAAAAKQGGIVAVSLESDVPLARATAASGGREAAMEKDADGRTFRVLVGVDFESAVGPREIAIEAEGLCGDRHAVRRALDVVAGRFPTQKLKVAPAYVEPPASELDRIREDKEKVARVWQSGRPERAWTGAFRPPIVAEIRDNFGARRVFNGQPRSPHDGLDIGAPAGTPVTAPAPGVVALADPLYFSGGTVILDHGAGLFTLYFHLSRVDVKPGDVLAPGQPIGLVGATGRVTGPHLHWGARLNRAHVNPLGLLKLPAWPPPRVENDLTSQSR